MDKELKKDKKNYQYLEIKQISSIKGKGWAIIAYDCDK